MIRRSACFTAATRMPRSAIPQRIPTHSAILGIKLEEKLKAMGVDVVLVYPGRPNGKYKSSADYLIDRLTQK